eukprot:2719949-Pyramimonas_sp.AAC.2
MSVELKHDAEADKKFGCLPSSPAAPYADRMVYRQRCAQARAYINPTCASVCHLNLTGARFRAVRGWQRC